MAFDLNKITSMVGDTVRKLIPVVQGVASSEVGQLLIQTAAGFVGISPKAIEIATKIVEGAVKAEPVALALFDQIKGGANPTAAELQKIMETYDIAHDDLDDAIDEAEAANAKKGDGNLNKGLGATVGSENDKK